MTIESRPRGSQITIVMACICIRCQKKIYHLFPKYDDSNEKEQWIVVIIPSCSNDKDFYNMQAGYSGFIGQGRKLSGLIFMV